jgi:hypothetical protein
MKNILAGFIPASQAGDPAPRWARAVHRRDVHRNSFPSSGENVLV